MQPGLFDERPPVDPDILARCLQSDVVAIDIETETRWSGIGPKRDYGLSYPAAITVIALTWREGPDLVNSALAAPFDETVRTFLKTLFTGPRLVVAHNAVFDMRQLGKLTGGAVPDHIWDTMVMARLIHPALGMSYSLLGVAEALGIPYSEQHQAMKGERSRLHDLPLATTLEYAQDDTRLTLQIYEKQKTLPADPVLVDWECRAMHEYCQMAATGVRLNVDFVRQRQRELSKLRDAAARRLQADGLATPNSSQARAQYLYQKKGIPLPDWDPDSWYFTRAGRHRLEKLSVPVVTLADLSTSSGVIESYMEEGSPYAERLKDLSDFMSADWLLSTLESLLDHAALDSRVHSLVTIATDTGRRASSHPQMQNWKMPDMAGIATGGDGFTLVELDLSNAENVMAAFLAADSNLAAACATDDFHSSMAARYFGDDWENADPNQRKRLRTLSKKITYGTAYGMGAERLGRSIDVSLEEAQRFLRTKDAAFPHVTRLKREIKQRVREKNRITLWTGRPIALQSEFVSWNYVCQGGVSELVKRAIVLIAEAYRERGLRSRVALDMHDAVILEVAHEEWDQAISLASSLMSSVTPEEMNNRTTPPIRWIASPKLHENRKKWGLGQWHPEPVEAPAP